MRGGCSHVRMVRSEVLQQTWHSGRSGRGMSSGGVRGALSLGIHGLGGFF